MEAKKLIFFNGLIDMQNKRIKILICSDNEAKISSATKVCTEIFSNFRLYNHNVISGVSETPEDDDEAIRGCCNRIKNIEEEKSSINADYIIALEGLTNKNKLGTFVYGWAVIKDVKNEVYYYGCSGKVMLPFDIASNLSKEIKLSDLVLSFYPEISSNDLKKLGTNGVLTNGIYTRIQEFETALKCAFGSMVAQRGSRYD